MEKGIDVCVLAINEVIYEKEYVVKKEKNKLRDKEQSKGISNRLFFFYVQKNEHHPC